jgi:hypothetical protein
MSRNRFNFVSIISHRKLYLTNNYPASIGHTLLITLDRISLKKNAQTDLHLSIKNQNDN